MRFPAITVAVASLQTALPTATAAAVEDGYTNPCEEFGTAHKLNNLYNDPPPADGCPDGSDSYMCAGIFIRGIGSIAEGSVAPPRPYFGTTLFRTPAIPAPAFTTGSSKLVSPACPATIVDGGEYPWWCATPQQIDLGAASFGYLRGDIAPPVDILHEWERTGKDPLTGWESIPRVLWPGPGIIFLQDGVVVDPDQAQPPPDDESFWDDRIGRFWPHDGVTKFRALCSDGPTISAMMLGVGGPPTEIAVIGNLTQCPADASEWTDADLPEGYDTGCPPSALDDGAAGYYNYTYEQTLANIRTWKEFQENAPDAIVDALSPTFTNIADPTLASCGIPPDKFDDVLVPANKYENWPEWRKRPMTEDVLGFGGVGAWNEVTIRSWNGVAFDVLGAHLVLFSTTDDDTENSEVDAIEYAKDFYAASAIGGDGRPAVRIPVVHVNMTSLYDDPSVSRPTVFTCVNSDDGQATEPDAEASVNSSDGQATVSESDESGKSDGGQATEPDSDASVNSNDGQATVSESDESGKSDGGQSTELSGASMVRTVSIIFSIGAAFVALLLV